MARGWALGKEELSTENKERERQVSWLTVHWSKDRGKASMAFVKLFMIVRKGLLPDEVDGAQCECRACGNKR